LARWGVERGDDVSVMGYRYRLEVGVLRILQNLQN